MNKLFYTTLLSSTILFGAVQSAMAASDVDSDDLLNMSLAELSNVEVTSVSKKAEKETEAAAAIFVITQEDIQRSGATAIPDLLRMAPGITVTQAGSHDWTVTARGSNDQFSNKLLVLMDGRTIYSPLFSGVIWDVQDTMLEDIDRIEVIRGPGATLWGANAVNGVINIITKNAKDTQGGLAVVSAGNQVKGIGSARYGLKVGEDSYVRMYAKQKEYNSEDLTSGATANDNWKRSQAGFRGDLSVGDGDKLTVQGDIYANDEDANYTIPDLTAAGFISHPEGIKAAGGNVLTRWERKHSEESQTTVQMYFDNTSYKTSFFNDLTNTGDIDVQNVWTGWGGQEIVWGAGYRLVSSENDPQSAQYSLTPKHRNDNLFNAFVQDKITLIPEDLFLTLGTKVEHNDYTGVEVQPSVRMSWLPAENQAVWGSVSRAVHTPYRYTDDAVQAGGIAILPGPTPVYILTAPNKSLKSEELIAYELGYRIQPTKALSFDLATFYNEYDELFFSNIGTPTTFVPAVIDNTGSGTSMGFELSSKWNVSNQWQLAGAYSYINEVFDKKTALAPSFVGKTPTHQFNVRSSYVFMPGVEMNNALYYVDDLNGVGIKGYYRFDTSLAYRVTDDIEVSIVGQNLFRNSHQEFSPFAYRAATEIGRSIYGSLTARF
ncbi:MAG: TonB-dependent receptor [Alphaproteobacteria bacterium]|nr:TonB-dependent receptor [Alphaproteobacteria bacterium]